MMSPVWHALFTAVGGYQHVIMTPSQLIDRWHGGRSSLLLGFAHSSIIKLALEHMLILPVVQHLVAPPHALPGLHHACLPLAYSLVFTACTAVCSCCLTHTSLARIHVSEMASAYPE